MIQELLKNQFLLSPSKNIAYALKHPAYALKVIGREFLSADERFLASMLGTTTAEIKKFINEPFDNQKFLSHMKNCETILHGVNSIGGGLYRKTVLTQYAIVRALKPDIVVETGVANGISACYILLAMNANGKGTLYSIDIADGSHLPPGKTVGWMMPDWLSSRWQVSLGDAKNLLPGLLKQLQAIDVFIHDSLHTYEHMMFEYQAAYPFIKDNGFLLSDDAVWNSSLLDFAKSANAKQVGVIRGLGVLKKDSSTSMS